MNSKFGTVKGGVEGLVGRGWFGGAKGEGLGGRAGRAHSVRPKSCDSPSSPEPAALAFGGDLVRAAGLVSEGAVAH